MIRFGWRTWALGVAMAVGSALGDHALRPAEAMAAAMAGSQSPHHAQWWQGDGRPSALAEQALALLAHAADQGLDPADYETLARARAWRDAGRAGTAANPAEANELSAALEAALLRYLDHLRFGRIDGRALYRVARLQAPAPGQPTAPEASTAPSTVSPAAGSDRWSADGALAQALAQGRLAELPRLAWPRQPEYAALQAALIRMRRLAPTDAWARPLPALPAGPGKRPASLREGQHWPGLPMLVQRLQWLGDLPAGVMTDDRYDGPVVEAVRRFQQRHGLAVDGRVGTATLAALDVTPAARAEQVALTLERLRWRPQPGAERWVAVNLPEFKLRLYRMVDGLATACAPIAVIVGQAAGHATPLMLADMVSVGFNPYWNVPPSIARHELVPKLRRDPGHAAAQGYEAVLPDGRVVQAADPAVLDAVLSGQARLRQRPGTRNALGGIKFEFPNRDNIYLHHTPSVGLFEQARRDFSHGCIRVQDPLAVAQFVLQDQPEWTLARIRDAIANGQTTAVRLREPLPVLISHETVVVDAGLLHFYPDLYGLDRALAEALQRRARAAAPPGSARP